MWWARQQPYEAAFLEKFLSLSKMLVHRVPTEIPTTGEEDWSGTQSVAALVGLVCRGVSSNYDVSSIAVNRENTFGVSLNKLAGRLSVPRRALAGRRKVSWRWDERFESLLYCVDLEARVSRLSTVDFPQECK